MKIKDMRQVLDIIEKYKGDDAGWVAGAGHDIVWLELSVDECPEDSEDGQKLRDLGCHVDNEEGWAKFV